MDELLKKILEDDSIPVKTVEEFEQEYEAEMQKPSKERDLDLLGELAESIMEMKGIKPNPVPAESIIALAKERRAKWRIKILKRGLTAVSVALILFLPLNFIAEKVYGMNFFSAIVQISKGKISLDFSSGSNKIIELPASEGDPYGLRAECEKNGMQPLLPMFLPEDFKLTGMDLTETQALQTAHFIYKKGSQRINVCILRYQDCPPEDFQIPTKNPSIEELTINGILVIVAKDKKCYSSSFCYNNTVYKIDTENVSYDLLIQILNSFQ